MSKTLAGKKRVRGPAGKAEDALKEAVKRVVEEHRQTGQPLAIWRDGRVALIHPDDLQPVRRSLSEARAHYKSRRGPKTVK